MRVGGLIIFFTELERVTRSWVFVGLFVLMCVVFLLLRSCTCGRRVERRARDVRSACEVRLVFCLDAEATLFRFA